MSLNWYNMLSEFCSILQISEATLATWMKIDPYWYGWCSSTGVYNQDAVGENGDINLYTVANGTALCHVCVIGVGNELWSAASLLSCYGSGWSAFLWRGRRPATTDSCHWFIQQGHYYSPLSYRTASVKIPPHQSLLGWLTVNRPHIMPRWRALFSFWPVAVEQFTSGVVPAIRWNRTV